MSTNSSSGSGGIGFAELLTIVFIVLKLTGHIDWSWWLVLAPAWAPFSLEVILLIIAGFIKAMRDEGD